MSCLWEHNDKSASISVLEEPVEVEDLDVYSFHRSLSVVLIRFFHYLFDQLLMDFKRRLNNDLISLVFFFFILVLLSILIVIVFRACILLYHLPCEQLRLKNYASLLFFKRPLDFLDGLACCVVNHLHVEELVHCFWLHSNHQFKITQEVSWDIAILGVKKHAKHQFKATEALVANS